MGEQRKLNRGRRERKAEARDAMVDALLEPVWAAKADDPAASPSARLTALRELSAIRARRRRRGGAEG